MLRDLTSKPTTRLLWGTGVSGGPRSAKKKTNGWAYWPGDDSWYLPTIVTWLNSRTTLAAPAIFWRERRCISINRRRRPRGDPLTLPLASTAGAV